jgi:HSP20 family molecular chaperone IbpA
MNNRINNAIGLIGSEIITVLQDISTPIINTLDAEINNSQPNIKYYMNDTSDYNYIFVCLELPGVSKEDCNIDFIGGKLNVKIKTNYQTTNCDKIEYNDFKFIKNKNLVKNIDLSHHNIDETSIAACYINGLLKIKLKKKPKTNININ